MALVYTSFLIRCWRLDGEECRLRIEHVQSGESAPAASLAAALAWIEARWDGIPGTASTTVERDRPAERH